MAGQGCRLLPALALFLLGCASTEAAKDDFWDEMADGGDDEDPVPTLTKSNFDKVRTGTLRLLVVFWGDKCRRCEGFAKDFRQTAEDLHEKNAMTKLAQVDARDGKAEDLVTKYKLEFFPAVLYFVNGTRGGRFNSVRTPSAMVNWVLRREGKFIKELDEDSVERWLSSGGFSFALVARVKPNTVRHKAFVQAVELVSHWDKDHTVLSGVVWLPQSAHANSDTSLLIHRNGFEEPDEKRLNFTGSWTGNNINKWARIATFPTIERNRLHLERYLETNAAEFLWEGMVVALVDDSKLTEEDTEEPLVPIMLEQFAELAKVEKRWKFAVSELTHTDLNDFKVLGVDEEGAEPQLCILRFTDPMKRFMLEGSEVMSQPGAVQSFFNDVRDGKVKHHYTSEPLPEEEFELGVRVLVGKNFDKYVLNPNYDVFVKFYAHWCQHCAEMAPVWEELARKVNQHGWHHRGVVIAQFNADDNECDEQVDKYPKLVLYPAVAAKDKFSQRFIFEHEANVESLADFLMDNAVNLEGIEDRPEL